MAQKQYGALEQHIITTLKNNPSFSYNNTDYNVILACKPRPSSGECKTDVYVVAENSNYDRVEFKISIKLIGTNEFQENKVNQKKAEAYFGTDWKSIIYEATSSISDAFYNRPLIYAKGKHPTKPNSITLGWKLEIANKPRKLSVKAPLTDLEIRNYVYKGTNQTDDKRNPYVNGERVNEAGVANYLLVTSISDIHTSNDIISSMNLIDEIEFPETHLIFTANNYRTDVKKADGPRPLAVYIEWDCVNGKLCYSINFDKPLDYTGEGNMKPILLEALNKLGKEHPMDFDIRNDLLTPEIVYR